MGFAVESDFERPLDTRLVSDLDLVAKVLARHEVTEGHDGRINLDQLLDVLDALFAALSGLEQIRFL